MNENTQHMFQTAIPLEELPEEEIIDLAGYQVTKAELFAHTREPAITIWQNRLKFNMACLRRFPGTTHIQVLINPQEKRMIIRPCTPDTPDCLRWTSGGGEKEIKTREMMCKFFAAKLFDLMGWAEQYRYKILGKPASCDGEFLFLFKLNDFELFVSGKRVVFAIRMARLFWRAGRRVRRGIQSKSGRRLYHYGQIQIGGTMELVNEISMEGFQVVSSDFFTASREPVHRR